MRKNLFTIFFLCYSISFLIAQEVRTIEGNANNLLHPEMGAKDGPISRVATNGYADLVSEPAGLNRPNPRTISNVLFAQEGLINDPRGLSDYAWVFGQFIDHDVVLIGDEAEESMGIPVPAFDEHFDPMGMGTVMIPMHRSAFDPNSGTDPTNPRSNKNEISAWIDASNVYGADIFRAQWLRTFVDGKLKTSAENMLPYNTVDGTFEGEIDVDAPEMAMENPFVTKWFVAGDIRANENTLLASMHTLFVREHNRICEELKATNPDLQDEALYQMARRRVGALIQSITYNEWLPNLGIELSPYSKYDAEVDANITNVFSAAAFRYGHTTINSQIIRMANDGEIIADGNTTLRDAFFNPQSLVDGGGLEPLLKGMATQIQQDFDCKLVDDLRNFLFGQPGAGGLDLAAINIQRGRERGLPDYNTIRADFGMEKISAFSELTSDEAINQIFAELYQDVNDIDPWVGMLAEDHMPNSLFGETAMTIVERQFQQLRDGDRFYFENDPAFSAEEITQIKAITLADIIRRNTDIVIHDEVFWAEPHSEVTTAINEPIAIDNQLISFPNPANGTFNLSLNSVVDGEGWIQISNNLGQLVSLEKVQLTIGENQFSINLSPQLSNGIYPIQLKTEKGMLSTRVLVVR